MKLLKTLLFSLIFIVSLNLYSLQKGDIIYTGGWFGIPYNIIQELPLGHVGIFAGYEVKNGKIEAVVIDCVPNYFKPGGIRKVGWKEFTHDFTYPYYGSRTTPIPPNQKQRDMIVKVAEKLLNPKAYSFTHFQQKGPDEFDCVGFVEHVYETVGLNPTPDKLETGYGWPLTPQEQFYSTVPTYPEKPQNMNVYISFKNKNRKTNKILKENIKPEYRKVNNRIPVPGVNLEN